MIIIYLIFFDIEFLEAGVKMIPDTETAIN